MAEELNQTPNEEIQIEELDDKELDEASGGGLDHEVIADNNGCNCGCS